MSALGAVILQFGAAGVVAGVAVPAVAYSFGVDRVLRHPLQHLELAVASILARFPAPRKRPRKSIPGNVKRYRGRHRKGRK